MRETGLGMPIMNLMAASLNAVMTLEPVSKGTRAVVAFLQRAE